MTIDNDIEYMTELFTTNGIATPEYLAKAIAAYKSEPTNKGYTDYLNYCMSYALVQNKQVLLDSFADDVETKNLLNQSIDSCEGYLQSIPRH